jgi:hypothetical protein
VSSHSRDQTSVQELALAKALKPSKKFSSGSSGLSPIEKAAATNVKAGRGKISSTSTGFGGADQALKALDLFDSGSSASHAEAATPLPCHKHPWKSPPLKGALKTFDAPTGKGMSMLNFVFLLS